MFFFSLGCKNECNHFVDEEKVSPCTNGMDIMRYVTRLYISTKYKCMFLKTQVMPHKQRRKLWKHFTVVDKSSFLLGSSSIYSQLFLEHTKELKTAEICIIYGGIR